MKILYVTTIGGTMNFFKSFINRLITEGHTIDIATNENDSKVSECYNEWGCTIHQIDTSRSPLEKGNLKAIVQLKTLVENEKYDIVHCHTPVAAMCTRLACRKVRKKGTRVIYTAHGFHFYKGAPLKNWLLFYPVERFCSRFTDTLITINKEDYAFAKRKMKAKNIEYVPGVGIDVEKFLEDCELGELKAELNIKSSDFVLLSVGELSQRKNHEIILEALSHIDCTHIKYLICGKGEFEDYLKDKANDLKIRENVEFLGFRQDVYKIYKCANIFVFPSIQEGLPVSLMEAMATGLPCIVSNIRGNVDLLDSKGGYFCSPRDGKAFAAAINKLYTNNDMRRKMGEYNLSKIKNFDKNIVNEKMKEIYEAIN